MREVRTPSNDARARLLTPVMGIELKDLLLPRAREGPPGEGAAGRAKKSLERQKPVTTATRTDRGEPGVMLLLLWAVAKYSRSNRFSRFT